MLTYFLTGYSMMGATVCLKQIQKTENWVRSLQPAKVSPMMLQQAQTQY